MDSAIGDRKRAKAILLDQGQLFRWNVRFENFNEFSVIHQFHLRTTLEEFRVVCENTASPFTVTTPNKDALVVRRADDLHL